MPVPAWFDDGKLGIFIHWGPYSAIGYRLGGTGYAEHVPKLMYNGTDYHPFMKERWGAVPPEFGYKDVIPEFKAEKWNPEAWAQLFADVGFKYCVMTAEHHDGWANWDSDLTPWNAMDKGPKRDLVGDLGKALKKHDIKYAPSYHRERHQTFFANKKFAIDGRGPVPGVAEEIEKVPEAASLYGPFKLDKEFVDDYVARWQEIQTKYEPDFLWIDDIPIWTRDGNKVLKGKMKPEVKYFYDQCRLMLTDFMNDGVSRGIEPYLNNKGGRRNWPDGVGCYEKDNLKLKVIGPKWQSCTTFGTSFGYLEGDTYKSVEGVIHEMVEVISRNGNFLINIGPKADGTIPEPQLERLMAMKDWLAINGEAIYGSRYWKVNEQKEGHLSFTTNGKKLYAIALAKPTESVTITETKDWSSEDVLAVKLLGSEAEVAYEMTEAGLKITPPADLGPSKYAWTFEILTNSEQHSPNVIVKNVNKALKGTKKVDIDGVDRGKKN